MAFKDDTRISVRKDVLSKVIDGEAVLLDLKGGSYFGLNEVGSTIWELIREGTTVGAIRHELLARYDVDATTAGDDLDSLLNDLQARGLVDIL
jgi:hypothetical protein